MPGVAGRLIKSQEVREQPVLSIKAADYPNFYLVFDPQRWVYRQDLDMLMPDFSRLRLSPGIGGVDARGNPALALLQQAERGRKVFKPEDCDYLTQYMMSPKSPEHPEGLPGYLFAWERVEVSGKRVEITTDFEAFGVFVAELMEQGKIPPPDVMTLRALRDTYNSTLRGFKKRSDTNGEHWDLVTKAIACIDKELKGRKDG